MSSDEVRGEFAVAKRDDSQQLVFGWASVSTFAHQEPLTDHHSHVIEPEDLELAAYDFVLSSRESGDMHQGGANGQLVESMMFTPEKLAKLGFPEGVRPAVVAKDGTRTEVDAAWWIGFHIDDAAAYDRVVKGERSMFSIQGQAVTEELDDAAA